jgi:hypothetical protein
MATPLLDAGKNVRGAILMMDEQQISKPEE